MNLLAEIDGIAVPLAKCDWVLWGPCGCPFGVTVGATPTGSIVQPQEEDAWKAFYDYKREIVRARRDGCRVELMTHERYCAEVLPGMRTGCPHGKAAS